MAFDDQANGYNAFYAEASTIRTVCFVWADQRRIFMNYGYLISGEFSPTQNEITLSFTTHTILLSGVNLEILFYDLMYHAAKQVICTPKRYNIIGDDERAIVNDIAVHYKR